MDQLIPSLLALVEGFRPCLRQEVFLTFHHLLVGWIVCPGPRIISEVWQATGRAADHHHDTAYSLFSSAVWEWDELGKILLLLIVTQLFALGENPTAEQLLDWLRDRWLSNRTRDHTVRDLTAG